MKLVCRYHPLLVTLHWLLALLIIAALTIGFAWLATMPNSDPQKLGVLRLHMAEGMVILALMAVRFAVRLLTAKPAAATTGMRLVDHMAPVSHYGFYVLVALVAGTGYATAIFAGLPDIVFAGSGEPLPSDFRIYPSRVAHGYLATLLAALIGLHFIAVLYHHFVRKDGLLRRMGLGRRQ
jgi:cytochrome b561